ncbi:family 20 glycosylhydrolase [Cellulosimicrobium marinum]|uniref:family 20 glycosylhydrolase n=1 Tax=Cellulosimicrobium marinum TaxID=1638992 RepID=UPI001E319035|nr:family 20 glycosylhydrolase [Cellulosimicrobium marinum]MCB7136989.1 beta-N-acetylhexosaminidase [Cellulosimicrobium marinum]
MVSLLPQPLDVRTSGASLTLAGVRVQADVPDAPDLADLAAGLLADVAGAPGAGSPTPVALRLDPAAGPAGSTSAERYSLVVDADGVVATAAQPAGLLHAVRSLRQLVERDDDGAGRVPHAVVHDAPRYPWRGLSVDLARTFFGPDALRAVIDVMGAYKLNVLHLHLTDDQGWRIESPSRPELAKLSSGGDCAGGTGGYLSLADFHALQEYAAQRYVTVVPEIDVPGHINAATHVYGELVPDGTPTDEYFGIEVGFSRLTFDLPATEPFLRDVFTDLAHATDGEYVHLGGDEVLKMEPAEYGRFVELCERVILEAGKKPVAWQEAARAPLRPGTVVQYWDTHPMDLTYLVDAAKAGARILMSPANKVYLDMKYTADFPLGQDWAGLVELRDSYDWDPEHVVDGMPADAIEGVEAAVWTERIATTDELFTMLLPRLSAVAEVAWTAPDRKDWEDYRRRVAVEAASWRRDGRAFHPSPQVDW